MPGHNTQKDPWCLKIHDPEKKTQNGIINFHHTFFDFEF